MTEHVFTPEEKKASWKILDAFQNEIPTNQTLVLKDVLKRFDLIQELKDRIDVRTTEEKVPAESVLFNSQSEAENEMQNRQSYENNFYSLLGKRQQTIATVKR
ncbi:hypothetical protein [Faecalibacter sp. LW9]|uniref:hypothetical protein n=1 Tax=Faecalibacter sp. LW9 TaxID=3103144 RepID=UPI002B000634|nr:hypothetical protein [Faecalibacter sp. LW9]